MAEESAAAALQPEERGRLLRVLGVVFGLAVTIGITVGMGILRTPGEVAAHLPNVWLFMGVWLLGGVYALFGAVSVAELGTMLPRSGGFYVFVRRALGEYPGFVVGWSDWLSTCGTAAAVALVMGEYAGTLVPRSGGQYVFVRRGLGNYAGFVVGWSDWLSTCGTTAAVSIVIGEYAGALVPGLAGADRVADDDGEAEADAEHAQQSAPSGALLLRRLHVGLRHR